MPAVELFPDIHSANDLQQALFSFPPEELEKYDRESRQLILHCLKEKADAHSATLPSYYETTLNHPEIIDSFHDLIGFVPLSLLCQVNEMWGADFESLEQYMGFIRMQRNAVPTVAIGEYSDEA